MKRFFLILYLLLAHFFGPGLLRALESDPPLNQLDRLKGKNRQILLEDRALKERSLTVYSILSAEESSLIFGQFRKRFPSIQILHTRGRGSEVWGKVVMEARAKHASADLVIGGTPELSQAIKDGLTARYFSPEASLYPKDFRDEQGAWIGVNAAPMVIAYNKSLKEIPKGYEDLTAPRWKGLVGMSTEPRQWALALLTRWGREKTIDYFRALKRNEPQIRRGGRSLLGSLICAGEFPVLAEIFAHGAAELMEKGCPIAFFTPEPMPVGVSPMSLVKNGPHPFAAALFYDWMLTVDGQKNHITFGRIPTRPGLEPLFPSLRGILTRPNLVTTRPEAYTAENLAVIQNIIREMLDRRS